MSRFLDISQAHFEHFDTFGKRDPNVQFVGVQAIRYFYSPELQIGKMDPSATAVVFSGRYGPKTQQFIYMAVRWLRINGRRSLKKRRRLN